MTSNKKDSTVRLIYKPNPEHKRSRSTPHIRITTNQNSKVERLCHNTFQVSEPPLDTYEGQFDLIMQTRKPGKNERHRNFLYERWRKEPFIYTERKKITFQPVPIAKGSCSVIITKERKGQNYLKINTHAKSSTRAKLQVKWNTFQWLIENRQDIISHLWKSYPIFIEFIKNKKKDLSKNDFCDLMGFLGLERDRNLFEKIFWALDSDNNGTIDHKELIANLEFFRDSTFDDKLKVFFEICDSDDSGNISPHEFYDLLKKNMATKEDKLKLKKIITYLFNQIDVNRDGVVTRVEFMRAASSNRELRRILDENMRIIQKNDKSTNNDFEEAFQEWLPGGFVANAKEGMHFPTVHRFVNLLKESEEVFKKNNLLKKKNRDEYLKLKIAQGIEVHSDMEDYGV